MKTTISLLFLMILLAGCSTGYHRSGFTGGYSDMKLQEDIFKVSFSGNGYTGEGKTSDFALLRCAELALENGYQYFIILGENSNVQTSTHTTPTTANTRGGVMVVGNSASFSSQTTYSGGETYYVNKPSARMTIQCFNEKPENIPTIIYDAEQIKTNIKDAYRIK